MGSSLCKVPSVTRMRRLSSNSRKNQIYKAFREVGRVMRTVALLRFLADSGLRARVTAATNKGEAYNGFSAWTRFGNQGVIAENDPAEQEKSVKWNSLLCKPDRVPHRDRHDGGHPAAGCRGMAGDR
jgi:TnpA family transposase